MKNTISAIKNSLKGLKNVLELAEVRVSKLEYKSTDYPVWRTERKKNEEKKPQTFMGSDQVYQHMHNGRPRRREEGGRKNIRRNIGQNFPNLIKKLIWTSKGLHKPQVGKLKKSHT